MLQVCHTKYLLKRLPQRGWGSASRIVDVDLLQPCD